MGVELCIPEWAGPREGCIGVIEGIRTVEK